MAVVTVVGASGAHVAVSINGAAALSLAKTYAAIVNGDASSGTLFAQNVSPGFTSETVPSGQVGEAVINSAGLYSVSGFSYITDAAQGPVALIETGVASSTSILAGTGGTVLVGGSGGGEFVAGGGNNLFTSLPVNSGDYNLAFGNGNDTVFALSGNDVVTDGVGRSFMLLGTGNNQVFSNGSDSILAGTGRDTITLNGSSSTVLGSTSGLLVNVVGTNNSVVGGTGADTLLSASGNNTLTGGTGQQNFFEFTKSATGGNFTITDFGSAAGNLVGLFGFGANEVATALATAKDVSGGSVIQLSDNTTLSFTNLSAEYLKANANKFIGN